MGSLHSTMFGDGSKCSNMFKSLHSASTRTTMGQIDLGMFQKSPAWLLSHSIASDILDFLGGRLQPLVSRICDQAISRNQGYPKMTSQFSV
jgi:hypothetical protein